MESTRTSYLGSNDDIRVILGHPIAVHLSSKEKRALLLVCIMHDLVTLEEAALSERQVRSIPLLCVELSW